MHFTSSTTRSDRSYCGDRSGADVCLWADFVAKVGCDRRCRSPISLRVTGFGPRPRRYATFTLRNTENLGGRRSCNQRCEPAQVLSDGGQNKLILGASWTTQSKSAELQDAFQVRKPHLGLLALTSRCLEALGASERPGNVAGSRQRTESPFVACLNRFLQQNRPKANVG
jgi:hypothetical protein